MANYRFTQDILEDTFFRANEKSSNSVFRPAVLRYVNRVYRAILIGGGEFVRQLNENWWWLRKAKEGVLTLVPRIEVGTVTTTQGSTLITFSEVVAGVSYVDRYFRTESATVDVFRIETHIADAVTAKLDSGYTGPSDTGVVYELLQLDYPLADDVLRLVAPMTAAQGRHHLNGRIDRIDVASLAERFPVHLAASGIPEVFAEIGERVVRFSHYGGRDPDEFARIDYAYSAFPPDLTLDEAGFEEPVLPLERRHLLADGAVFWLFKDKDDPRATDAGQSVQAGLRSMARENRWKQEAAGGRTGHIAPRQAHRPLRQPVSVVR